MAVVERCSLREDRDVIRHLFFFFVVSGLQHLNFLKLFMLFVRYTVKISNKNKN